MATPPALEPRATDFEADLVARLRADRSTAFRASEIADELWRKDFEARIESGLLDRDKYANYLKLVQKEYSTRRAPARTAQEIKEAFVRYDADILQMGDLPVPIPMPFWFDTPPIPSLPQPKYLRWFFGSETLDPSSSIKFSDPEGDWGDDYVGWVETTGNTAKLCVSAISDWEPYPPPSTLSAEASATFNFDIPMDHLPRPCWVGFYPTWNISGDYEYQNSPSKEWSDAGARLWLDISTSISSWEGVHETEGTWKTDFLIKLEPVTLGINKKETIWEPKKIGPIYTMDVSTQTSKIRVHAGIHAASGSKAVPNLSRLMLSAEVQLRMAYSVHY